MEQTKLPVEKKGIVEKIKQWFQSFFSKKEVKNIEKLEESQGKKEVVIPNHFEELNIARLQEKYREGNLKLEDLEEEEFKRLVELYQRQNEELEHKIEKLKQTD